MDKSTEHEAVVELLGERSDVEANSEDIWSQTSPVIYFDWSVLDDVNHPTVFLLCNMHLKLMHFRSNFACILGRFLVHIELNLNAKYAASSVDFVCKMQ